MASADQRINFTEYMVGASHPTSADTLNRHGLVDHGNSGAHTAITRADLLNNSGSAVAAGDVVVQDTTGASRFTLTTVQGDAHDVYVVVEGISSADTGRVAYAGYATVKVQGNVAIGDFLRTSTTSGRAESAGTTLVPGVFARAYTAYSGGGAGTVTARFFSAYIPQGLGATSSPSFASLALTNNTNQLVLGATNTGTLSMATLSASRTWTFPNVTGTVITSGDANTVTIGMLAAATGLTAAAVGDLLYASATTPTWSRLGVGGSAAFLRSTGSAPAWSTITLPNSVTTGDLLMATGTNAVGVRAAGAAGQVLIGQGSGVAPIWSSAPVINTISPSTGSPQNQMTVNGRIEAKAPNGTDTSGVLVLTPNSGTGQSAFLYAVTTTGTVHLDTASGAGIILAPNGTTVLTLTSGGGVQVGAPTGGDKGAGTVNHAGDIYKNNTAYTNPDYVLERWATGRIVRFVDCEGADRYDGLWPLADVERFARAEYVLPRIAEARAAAESGGGLGLFGGGDALMATVEESYLYLFDHEREIAALRARIAGLETRRN